MIAENNSVCVVATADDVRKRQHNKPTFGLIGICKDERGRWRPGRAEQSMVSCATRPSGHLMRYSLAPDGRCEDVWMLC